MLQVETKMIGERFFKRTYSDAGFCIRKKGTNEFYAEAYDLPESTFEYEETDREIGEDLVQEN